MARNASGSHSLPAGNPVVTATTITTTWANDTLNDLSAEITNSLARDGKGPMTAALELVNGTVGTPALSFDSEANTGVYRAGAADVRLSIAGTDRAKATATSWFYDMVTALTATGLSLKGAIADGATAVGVIIDNTIALTNSAAKIASFRNSGTEKLSVNHRGTLISTVVATTDIGTLVTTGANAPCSLVGNADAAAAGPDVILTGTITRTAGKIVSVQNNDVEKAYIDKDGQVIGLNTWHLVMASADRTTTSSAFGNVTDLSFAVSASANYEWECRLAVSRAATATALQMQFTGPAASTAVTISGDALNGDESGGGIAHWRTVTAFSSALGTYVYTGATTATATVLTLRGLLRNGANAGTVQLQFASSDNTNTVTVLKGSTINWRRIDATE